MKSKLIVVLLIIFCSAFNNELHAQFSLSAQLRTRTELRDGQSNPAVQGSKPAFFTSQRTRLTAGYSMHRLQFGLTLQDVRVWGQDVSTINRTTTQDNSGLMLHEAWAEIDLTDSSVKTCKLALKIGRQELIYDDQRLIGNLDWLQQARRHDAAVLKYTAGKWMAHAGFAYNQNKENASGTKYNETPAGSYAGNTNGSNMYKSFAFLYVNRKLTQGAVSFLLFNDQFNKYHNNVENNVTVKVWDAGSWNRLTTGLYFTNQFNQLSVTAAGYYQTGKTFTGQKLTASLLSANVLYSITKKLSVGPGFNYTSGGSSNDKSDAFDPLYGTPHKFWGAMDYFYAASGFGNKGLKDFYLKLKYKPTEQWQLLGELHRFSSASAIYDPSGHKMGRDFGTEADLTGSYALTKTIGFELGYSHYLGTASLASPSVKNITDGKKNNNWAYLMVKIQPTLFIATAK